MNGEKDKTFKLYKRFISTTLFRKWMNDKKKDICERELERIKGSPTQQQISPQTHCILN
jgi:hypothetical protein